MSMMLAVVFTCVGAATGGADYIITFEQRAGRMGILVDGEPFAVYVYEDTKTLRPYFCDVKAPNGAQATRNHPPDPEMDKDNMDHDTFHPGIWLAFGDLGREDFWRNKARVRHLRFEEAPQDGAMATFTVVNAYETSGVQPRILCEETCAYTITADGTRRLITSKSRFQPLEPGVCFGDQEEMGCGVRIATTLTVRHGSGVILNNHGDVNEKGTWGKQANWCAYSGVVNGCRVGVMLMAGPGNFRQSWFHNRDYGLMVANPFGKKSMTAPTDRAVSPDATPLKKDMALELSYAVCVFSTLSEEHPEYQLIYEAYVNH